MKRYSKKIVSFVLVVMMSITMFVPVFANGEISVYLDNEKIQFDVTPLLIDGRTMVPMRVVFEKLGAVVYWDNNTRTAIAQRDNVNVSIAIDDTTLYKNGQPIVLDVPAQLNSGRTLVPLRAVSEAFDCTVFWNGDTQTVRILSAESFIEPPKNIRVVRQQNGSAHIQWDKVEEAEYYHFYYQEAGEDTFWFDEEDDGSKLKFEYCDDYTVSYNGLENGKIYNVIVTSVKNGVESSDSEILTFIYDSSDSQEDAFTALKNFIITNSNDSIDGDPVYKEIYKSGNVLKQYSLDYSAKTDLITLKVIYNGNYTAFTYIGLRADKKNFFAMLLYFDSSSSSSKADFEGDFTIYPNNYDLSSKVTFSETIGDTANVETYKVMALMNSLEGLDFADYVFKTYLSNKNVSLSDFGFNVPSSGYTPIEFGNPITDNTNNYQSSNNYQGGGNYSINTNITLSSFPLYLYADDGTGTFLGEISSNKYDTDSIANEYGNYGSKYQTKSIFNQYGNYGSKYSQYSVFNEYATHPPKILDKNGKVVGYLTANKYIKDAISYEEMMVLLKKFNK